MIRVLLMALLTTSSALGQVYYFGVKPSIYYTFDPKYNTVEDVGYNTLFEYSFLWDARSYYNSKFNGFGTGLKLSFMPDMLKISVPVVWTSKANEWNDYVKIGVIGNHYVKRPRFAELSKNSLDVYFNFGFDNEFSLRSPFKYNISIYGQYTILPDKRYTKLCEIGLTTGIIYVVDYYHYRNRAFYKNTKNR